MVNLGDTVEQVLADRVPSAVTMTLVVAVMTTIKNMVPRTLMVEGIRVFRPQETTIEGETILHRIMVAKDAMILLPTAMAAKDVMKVRLTGVVILAMVASDVTMLLLIPVVTPDVMTPHPTGVDTTAIMGETDAETKITTPVLATADARNNRVVSSLIMHQHMASQSIRAREGRRAATTIAVVVVLGSKNLFAMTTPMGRTKRNINILATNRTVTTTSTVVLEKSEMIQTMKIGSMASTGIQVVIAAITRSKVTLRLVMVLPQVTHRATEARTKLTALSV